MKRVLLLLGMLFVVSPAFSAPSLPECSIPKLGAQLPQRVLDTLLAIKTSLPHTYQQETDISALAYQQGYFTKVAGCTQPGVSLKADKTGYTLTLALNDYGQCVAIEKSPLFARQGIQVEITHLPRPNEKRCLKNPISGFFRNKIPHANQATFFVPVSAASQTPASTNDGCKTLEKSRYQDLRKKTDQALDLIRQYTTTAKVQLAAFEQRGGRFFICDTVSSGTAFHDFHDVVFLVVDQEKGRSLEEYVRVLLEEIAHTAREQTGWPHPKDYKTQGAFAAENRDHLVDYEAKGWIEAWIGALEIKNATQYNIPMTPNSRSFCLDDLDTSKQISVSEHLKRFRQYSNQNNWSLQQQLDFTGEHCVKVASVAPNKTYDQHYYGMSERIYDAYQNNRMVVVRGRPMVNETR